MREVFVGIAMHSLRVVLGRSAEGSRAQRQVEQIGVKMQRAAAVI